MTMEIKKEPLLRVYGSLKDFIGENKVYKCGDVLYVSTKGNGHYDKILTANGTSTFRELWNDDPEGYSFVMVKND